MSKVKNNFLTAGSCVAIALICLFGFIMLQNLFAAIFINLGWETNSVVDLFPYGFWVAFIVYAILPPILEEIIFRLLICKGLQWLKLPTVWIVISSAVVFMLYHWSWSQVVYQLIMGIFFAWIFLRTNNILWTMLIHFINNAFIVTYTYFAGSSDAVMALSAGNIILSVVLAAASTVAVTLLIKKGIPYAKK